MTQTASVLDKAHALAAESSRLKEGQAADANAARVSHRVDETMSLLTQLQRAVTAARRLQGLGAAIDIDLSVAEDGRTRFARHAAGLPSNQVFAAANQKIKEATAQTAAALTAAWTEWTRQRLEGLPTLHITMLDPSQQQEATTRKDELRRLARRPPTPGEIESFLTTYGLLQESLAGVQHFPPDLLELIDRLSARPATTLAQISDDQLALLRAHQVAARIELHWRGL